MATPAAFTVDFITANVLHGRALPADRFLEAFAGFQEADTDEWHRAAEDTYGDRIHHGWGPLRENTLTWPPGWRLLEKSTTLTHKGREEVSPHRGWVDGIFCPVDDLATTLGVIDTHAISGVRGMGKPPRLWRRRMWRRHMRALRKRVRELLARCDYVVVLGDFNQLGPAVDRWLKPLVRLTGDRSIDHIYASPGLRLVGKVERLEDHGSDHDPRRARLTNQEVPVPPTPPQPKPTETQVAKVIRIAQSQIGVHEGRSGGHWNNDQKYSDELPGFDWSDGQPWCDTFVGWCAWKAGIPETAWPRSASCDASGAAFKRMRRWSEYPAIGAQVFFGTPSDLSHTGIVVAYDDTWIWTVEGNTNASGSREGDGVYAKQHRRTDPRVIGYGYPAYDGGIKSADPAWRRQNPTPKPVPVPEPDPAKPANLRAAELVGLILKEKDVQRDDVAALLRGGVRDYRANKIEPAAS